MSDEQLQEIERLANIKGLMDGNTVLDLLAEVARLKEQLAVAQAVLSTGALLVNIINADQCQSCYITLTPELVAFERGVADATGRADSHAEPR